MTLIRDATLADVALLGQLGRRTYLDHYRELWLPAGLEAYLAAHFAPDKLARELADDSVRYLLVVDENEAIGFAKLNRDRPLPSPPSSQADARGLELQKIYFLHQAAGRGHGSRLMAHIFAVGRALGQPLVWLDVLKTNHDGLRFYERHGFVRHGELAFATDKLDVGMWLMHRAL
jgi:ribosomal protein S18 acetylase RimI-like enzyme